MALYDIDELKDKVSAAAYAYNKKATSQTYIDAVSLFGSYANGSADTESDVDLLISFQSSVVSLITLARVLSTMEDALGLSVDIVQEPLPADALFTITQKVPLYERLR